MFYYCRRQFKLLYTYIYTYLYISIPILSNFDNSRVGNSNFFIPIVMPIFIYLYLSCQTSTIQGSATLRQGQQGRAGGGHRLPAAYIYIYIYMHTYMCIYIYIYIHTYIHTYTHIIMSGGRRPSLPGRSWRCNCICLCVDVCICCNCVCE